MNDIQSPMILVLGGISSGKSEFAEQLIAEAHGRSESGGRFFYFTPAPPPGDEEMRAKIEAHRERRPGWLKTVECGTEPSQYLSLIGANDTVLFDSAGTLAGLLVMEDPEAADGELFRRLEHSLAGFFRTLSEAGAGSVIVSEESGMSLVADNSAGRKFQKIMGRLNRLLAAESDIVYLVTAGIPMRLK